MACCAACARARICSRTSDLQKKADFGACQGVSETADDAAALQRLAVDVDGGDGDHHRMAESGKSLAHIDNAVNGNCKQRQHGDDVISLFSSNGETELCAEDSEYICLLNCHGAGGRHVVNT